MDGVLAKYELNAYQPIDGNTPKFIDTSKHYYLTVQPDEYMIKLTQILVTRLNIQYKLKAKIHAITRLHENPALAMYQLQDKQQWLSKNCSHINNLTPCLSYKQPKDNIFNTKAEILTILYNKHLTPYDVLIDDFNQELTSWQKLGGTAIKYNNGINSSSSWNGICFNDRIEPINNVKWLLTLIEQLQT